LEERHRRRQQQLIQQALPQLQAQAKEYANALKPLEFNGKSLPRSKMAVGPGSAYGNTYENTYGSRGSDTAAPSPAWLPEHMRLPPAGAPPSSSVSSQNYSHHHHRSRGTSQPSPLQRSNMATPSSTPPPLPAGPDGYDESAELAQVLVLESAIDTVRVCARAYGGPRSVSGAGLGPLAGQSYSLKEFRQVVKHTLGLQLSPGQVYTYMQIPCLLARSVHAYDRKMGTSEIKMGNVFIGV